MTNQIKLRHVENGFILDWAEYQDDDTIEKIEKVFEDKEVPLFCEDDCNARAALVDALNAIVHHFDLGYHKHHRAGDKFIKIQLIDGEKFFADEK